MGIVKSCQRTRCLMRQRVGGGVGGTHPGINVLQQLGSGLVVRKHFLDLAAVTWVGDRVAVCKEVEDEGCVGPFQVRNRLCRPLWDPCRPSPLLLRLLLRRRLLLLLLLLLPLLLRLRLLLRLQ